MVDPVCAFHGKRASEHECLYCTLCFDSTLTPITASVNLAGEKEDVCWPCASWEENEREIIDDFGKGSPYRFLSNFYPDTGPTSEHLYQAFKGLGDAENIEGFTAILNADTPGKAKRLGRQIKLRSDWDEVKDEIMLTILRGKFKRRPLRDWLVDTRRAVLIEGNKHGDTYWGATRTGSSRSFPAWRGNHGVVWYGKNMLGILLMQVRHEIKEGKL